MGEPVRRFAEIPVEHAPCRRFFLECEHLFEKLFFRSVFQHRKAHGIHGPGLGDPRQKGGVSRKLRQTQIFVFSCKFTVKLHQNVKERSPVAAQESCVKGECLFERRSGIEFIEIVAVEVWVEGVLYLPVERGQYGFIFGQKVHLHHGGASVPDVKWIQSAMPAENGLIFMTGLEFVFLCVFQLFKETLLYGGIPGQSVKVRKSQQESSQ